MRAASFVSRTGSTRPAGTTPFGNCYAQTESTAPTASTRPNLPIMPVWSHPGSRTSTGHTTRRVPHPDPPQVLRKYPTASAPDRNQHLVGPLSTLPRPCAAARAPESRFAPFSGWGTSARGGSAQRGDTGVERGRVGHDCEKRARCMKMGSTVRGYRGPFNGPSTDRACVDQRFGLRQVDPGQRTAPCSSADAPPSGRPRDSPGS